MAAIDTDELTALAREIAAGFDPRIRVEGVTSADGGAGRAELLLSIMGCHDAPCSIMVNVDRSNRDTVERDVSELLTAAMAAHLTSDEV